MNEVNQKERTFIMIKPDGVLRGLVGQIISRIESTGLKIVGLKLITASKEAIDGFYPSDQAWIQRLGEKTLSTYKTYGINPIEELNTDDALEIGRQVREWLLDFMTSGPIVPIVVEGIHAIEKIRKLAGETMPVNSTLGTIRGDFSSDSAAIANKQKRAVFNIVHATENAEEASEEIQYWFDSKDLSEYRSADDEIINPER